jgi:hypothetical protein
MNENLFVKKLNQHDFFLLENFLINSQTFSKQENKNEVVENWKTLIKLSLNDLNSNVIACLEDNKIKAVVSQTLSVNHPVWFMNYFATEKNLITIKNGYGKYLELCFQYVTKFAEEKGYYDFYVSVPEGYANTGPLMQKKSKSWSKYYVLTDVIVPENEYPVFPAHKAVYGKILKKHKVFIRHAVLKQEFRKEKLTPLSTC